MKTVSKEDARNLSASLDACILEAVCSVGGQAVFAAVRDFSIRQFDESRGVPVNLKWPSNKRSHHSAVLSRSASVGAVVLYYY